MTIEIQDPSSFDKEAGIQYWNLESTAWDPGFLDSLIALHGTKTIML